MTFNEANVNREQDGKFGNKVGGSPEIALEQPTVPGHVVFERWDHDNAEEVGRSAEFSVTDILDTKSLDEIRDLRDEDVYDEIFFDAVETGALESYDGPFTMNVDEDALNEYLDKREAAGQEDALTDSAPLTVEKQREIAGKALADARSCVPVAWVLSASDRSQQARVRESFGEAAAALEDIDYENLDYKDKVVVQGIRDIATGTDPRGGTFREQSSMMAAQLADHLLNRDEYFKALDQANNRVSGKVGMV